MEFLMSVLSPVISILPFFTVIGSLVDSIILFLLIVAIYYVLSTRFFVLQCAFLNMILWPVGFVLSLIFYPWWWPVLYVVAFLLMMWNGKTKRREGR